MNPIAFRQFLVLPGLLADVAFLGAHLKKAVVEILIGIRGILFQDVVEISLRVVVGCRKVLREKDFYGERLRKR